MNKKVVLSLFVVLVGLLALAACSESSAVESTQNTVPVETITLNAHPISLEGKTVVLRWNSKTNGDLYLNRIAELLTEQVKDIKIIKLYETDPDTVKVSESIEDAVAVAEKIAVLNPDLVIASQAD